MLEAFMNKGLYIKITMKDKPLLPELKEIIGLDWNSGADFVNQATKLLSGGDPIYITVSTGYTQTTGERWKKEGTGIVFTINEPENFVYAETFIRESKQFELDQNQYEKVWEYELN